MAEPGSGAPSQRSDRPGRILESGRIIVGLVVLLVFILAALALINSFFLEPPAAEGPRQPTPTPGSGEDGGGGGKTCKDFVPILLGVFITFATLTAILFGLAVARRSHNQNRIATSVWGILATIGFFFSLISLGVWRLVDVLCKENLNCQNTSDGTYTTFLLLLALTLASFAFGIGFAFKFRRNFFLTGWGIIAIVLYVPTILAGMLWYVVRVGCTQKLNCALRDEFLRTLAWIGWLSFAGAVLAFLIGYLVQRKFKFNMFASGWGILGVCGLLLAGGAWYGYDYVDDLKIPGCDKIELQEFNETVKTCQEMKDDIQGRIKGILWSCVAIGAVSGGVGGFFYRDRWRKVFSSPWAIIAYIAFALAILAFLLLLVTDSMCGGDGGDDRGDGSNRGGGGNGNGIPGNPGGGGGPGGPGAAPGAVPINLGAIPLMWVLIIIGVIIVAAILLLLLKKRATLAKLDAPPQAQTEVEAQERQSLMRILDNRALTSTEAVIAAYRSFLAWCADRGLGKDTHETPREHADRVRERYPVPERAMRDFVLAYEVARLSSRPPSPEERNAAVRFSKEIDAVQWSQPAAEKKPEDEKKGGAP